MGISNIGVLTGNEDYPEIVPGKKYRFVYGGEERIGTAVKTRGDERWPVFTTDNGMFTVPIKGVLGEVTDA